MVVGYGGCFSQWNEECATCIVFEGSFKSGEYLFLSPPLFFLRVRFDETQPMSNAWIC